MITNKGKSVLAKYLIGQAPSYASHIAFGCGPEPVLPGVVYTTTQMNAFSEKTALDFEMFRAPIISRGYVTENVLDSNGDILLTSTGNPVTISQIVFTAELPTDERYEITEMGVFSAGANPSAGSTDSKILNTFSESENWEYHYKSDGTYPAIKIPVVSGQLDADVTDKIDTDLNVFRVNADNVLFANNVRVNRNERCRFFNSMLLVAGDKCKVLGNTDSELYYNASEDNTHIHFNGVNFNLDRNSGTDIIKVGLSIINRDASSASNPTSAKIIVEFASPETEAGTSAQYARLKKIVTGDFTNNRYYVVSDTLENLEKSAGFSWGAVSVVKIYVSVLATGDQTSFSNDFFVALDAIRLENVTTVNPLYGLTAYTIVKNENALPIIKNVNSATLAEFRFAIDVLDGT